MKSETYKYQRYLSPIFIIKLLEVLIVIVLLCNVLLFNTFSKESVFYNSLFFLILFTWYSVALFKKYNSRFNTLITFDTDKITAVNGHKSEIIKVDKNLEIWVLSSKSNSYQQYFPYLKLRNNALIIIGNSENLKDNKIRPIKNTTLYDNNIQHLEKPFGHGYISIVYRQPLSEWLNLYNKQIERDRYPVASYKHMAQHNKLSEIGLHHYY